MSLFTGLMIGAGVNLIYGLASIFGILNTSIQGFSNISYLMRNNPNCKDIMKIIDNELLLEVRIKVIQHFFDDLQSIKISTKTKEICEFIIKKLKIIKLFSVLGNDLKTVKYQKNICKINGKFLNNSTYINASLLIIQFEESLEIPIINPSIVAKNIPKNATNKVFNNPTRYAFP